MKTLRKSGAFKMEFHRLLTDIIHQYQYTGLFILFIIDTLGVFLPSKTILTLTGVLLQSGQLTFLPLFLSALTGSLTGFSISYLIGLRIGKPFLLKYGSYLRITDQRISQAEGWFHRFGPAFIIVAYFTPGLRHITPYLSGIAGFSYYKSMVFAAIGAVLWITAFVTLGNFLGHTLEQFGPLLHHPAIKAVLPAALILFLGWFIRQRVKKSSSKKE